MASEVETTTCCPRNSARSWGMLDTRKCQGGGSFSGRLSVATGALTQAAAAISGHTIFPMSDFILARLGWWSSSYFTLHRWTQTLGPCLTVQDALIAWFMFLHTVVPIWGTGNPPWGTGVTSRSGEKEYLVPGAAGVATAPAYEEELGGRGAGAVLGAGIGRAVIGVGTV